MGEVSLHQIENQIFALSGELNDLGNEQVDIANLSQKLKTELEAWAIDQHDVIREKEKGGRLEMRSGESVKLTDAIRDRLIQYGKREQFAKYEGLKRRAERLDSAIKAKIAALTGLQTLASIQKKEMELLDMQP